VFRSAKRPAPDTRPCPVTQQRCARECPGECQRIAEKMSRRRFIFLGTAAAAAVVAGPAVELAPSTITAIDWGFKAPYWALDTAAVDGLLKLYYEPYIVHHLNPSKVFRLDGITLEPAK
jgi:hypothetical protein